MIRAKLLLLIVICISAACTQSQEKGSAGDEEELRERLTWFLQGASENSVETHKQFWHDDLIYTGSDGRRVTKDDILSGYENGDVQEQTEPEFIYGAEEVQVQLFGETAVVAFLLVAESDSDTLKFYNTGTFRKTDGAWLAVAWQATRIP